MSIDNESKSFSLSEDDVNSVIAEVTTSAPTEDIKNVLRTYEYGKTIRTLEKEFNRHKVTDLEKTSAHLNIDNGTKYLKPELINNIICRIQNLFPEKCGICNEVYCTKNNDKPLLPCAQCGQEAHAPCLLSKLGIDDTPDKNTVQKMINPFSLNDLFYFCDT